MKRSGLFIRCIRGAVLSGIIGISPACGESPQYSSLHDKSTFIRSVEFDLGSIITMAPGSDNWAITWASDGAQYTTWGDGGGFGGTNSAGRVSMGIARIDGTVGEFRARNIWGGYDSLVPAQFTGKSYGILAVGNGLWLWRTGTGSGESAFRQQDLFFSGDNGKNWQHTGVRFSDADFVGCQPFFAPTFLQAGPGYSDRPDNYVYIYSPTVVSEAWDVQVPGEIALIRVPHDSMKSKEEYEYFSGFDEHGNPGWTRDVCQRESVYRDDVNGVMRTSVTYNSGLGRYLLVTQQVSRLRGNGHMGIYEARTPWGPWKTVLFDSPWRIGLQTGEKSVYWNFSNKWTHADGKDFALVYTGPGSDSFGVVRGRFVINEDLLQ